MFEYKPFRIGEVDIEQFCEMYRKCLGQAITREYLLWKYENNPAGKMIGYIALSSDNRIAGFYGVIPERFLVNGKETVVYQSMDTMTHPDFQKKGLFVSLAGRTYDEIFRINPDALIIGIPGSNSFHGFINKLNWHLIHSVNYIFLSKHLFYFISKLKFLKYKKVTVYDDTYNNQLKRFFEAINYNAKIQPLYDFEFIKWRIFDHPYRKYKLLTVFSNSEIESILIYSIDNENRCVIDCYLTLSQNNIGSFVNDIFRNENVSWIYTWSNSYKSRMNDYSRFGFLKNPFNKGPFSYKIPFICFSNRRNPFEQDINNYDTQPIIQD